MNESRKKYIVLALMVAMFLGAIEGTVVTTAVPTIVKELSGFELISWVFSLYLLTSAVSTPIYGKLADLYGRKRTLSAGIVIFLIGSCLCGLSQNMAQLIAFRALQGVGAGAIFTLGYTIVGDIFSLQERVKVQAWLSSVWGIAGLLGPFLGGFFIDYLSWNWIFYINLPFGILSIVLLERNMEEECFEKRKHKIDFLGIITLSAAILAILYGILTSGAEGGFPGVILLLAVGILLLVAFYFIEKKAAEPVIPFEVFTKSNFIVNIISFLSAAVLVAMDVYVPVYIQNVLGFTALISGLTLASMSISWLLTSPILSKTMHRYSKKTAVTASCAILLLSTLLLPFFGVATSLAFVVLCVFISGFGFGGSFTLMTIMIQDSVGYDKRGAATASNALLRTLGQTIGISVFGSLLNSNIIRYFNERGIEGVVPNDLYSAKGILAEHIKGSQSEALQVIFLCLIAITAVCLILTMVIPKEEAKRTEKCA